MWYVNAAGLIVVFDGTSEVVLTGVGPVPEDTWVQFTARVDYTIVGGRVVYRRDGAD